MLKSFKFQLFAFVIPLIILGVVNSIWMISVLGLIALKSGTLYLIFVSIILPVFDFVCLWAGYRMFLYLHNKISLNNQVFWIYFISTVMGLLAFWYLIPFFVWKTLLNLYFSTFIIYLIFQSFMKFSREQQETL